MVSNFKKSVFKKLKLWTVKIFPIRFVTFLSRWIVAEYQHRKWITVNTVIQHTNTKYRYALNESLQKMRNFFHFYHGATATVGQGLLIIEDSYHSDTPQPVGLLLTSYQPDAETSTWQHSTIITDRQTDRQADRHHNPSKRATAEPRLRPRDHWDRLSTSLVS